MISFSLILMSFYLDFLNSHKCLLVIIRYNSITTANIPITQITTKNVLPSDRSDLRLEENENRKKIHTIIDTHLRALDIFGFSLDLFVFCFAIFLYLRQYQWGCPDLNRGHEVPNLGYYQAVLQPLINKRDCRDL